MPTIDERIQALVHTAELAQLESEAQRERIRELAETSERHEREIQRFRRAMRGALEAWLREDGDGEGNDAGAR